jgi:hypothetical protein
MLIIVKPRSEMTDFQQFAFPPEFSMPSLYQIRWIIEAAIAHLERELGPDEVIADELRKFACVEKKA